MQESGFLEFGSKLINLEKTRNFNIFKEYSLESFRIFLDKYGWRERRNPRLRISVVGTNGKGSVSHFLAQIFTRLGLGTGLYTSPHLLDPRERIRKSPDLAPISDRDLQALGDRIFQKSNLSELSELSWFEWFTLGAFVHFESENLEVQIFEAGLGGRLDATRLAEADLVVLCSIGEDHKSILGDTKAKILQEKLNISGPKTRLLLSMEHQENLDADVRDFCAAKGIEVAFYPEKTTKSSYLDYNLNFSAWGAEKVIRFFSNRLPFLETASLPGTSWLSGKTDLALFGDSEIRFFPPPGRLELLSIDPEIVFDPAHNPDAVRTTLEDASFRFSRKYANVIAGFLPDKDGETMAEEILSYCRKNGTEATFLGGGEFKLPKGYESFLLHPSDFSNKLFSFSDKGVLVLGSFRLYKYVIDALRDLPGRDQKR